MTTATTDPNRTTESDTRSRTPAEIAWTVKTHRSSQGWTQEKLSGLDARTIQRVEQGQPISPYTRRAIGRAFKYDDIDFFNTPKDNPTDDGNDLKKLCWLSGPFSEEPLLGSTFYKFFGVMFDIEELVKKTQMGIY